MVPGSGAFDRPGDVRDATFLAECKTTAGKGIRVTIDMITKLTAEADTEALTPLLALRLEGVPDGVDRDWFAVPARIFVAMFGRMNSPAVPRATSPPG